MSHFLGFALEIAVGAARAVARNHKQAKARDELRTLDEHMLRDVGLSHRAAAESFRGGRDIATNRESFESLRRCALESIQRLHIATRF